MNYSEIFRNELHHLFTKFQQELHRLNPESPELEQIISRFKSDIKQELSDSSKIFPSGDMQSKYEFIVNNAKEFMSLINHEYKFVAANDSYCSAHNLTRSEIIGKSLSDIWGEDIFNNIIKKYIDDCFAGNEIHYEEWFEFTALGKRYFDVRYYPYYGKEGSVTHVVVITHDITKRKNAEIKLQNQQNHLEEIVHERTVELEEINQQLQSEIIERKQSEERQTKLIADLREALQNIKRLEGLIPICANCKKIRDDRGYWEEVEAYLRDHSEVEFTHGICPECFQELYPDFAKNKMNKPDTSDES